MFVNTNLLFYKDTLRYNNLHIQGTIQPWLPPVIFGIGPIIGAALCLLLPETMNCELPETIEDGENFGKYVFCINS